MPSPFFVIPRGVRKMEGTGTEIKHQRLTKLSSLGSVISAFLASVCCVAPVIFALLGVGGAGFAVGLERYRPIFVAVAVVFLGIAFYYTYRKKGASCEIDSVCSTSKGGKFNKVILWVSAVLVGFFIVFPSLLGWILG